MTDQDEIMNKPSKNHDNEERKPATDALLRLMERLIDGVDGYECEHGDLRYWNRAEVQHARRLIGAIEAVQ